MAKYVPLMDKSRNEFLSDANNGLDQITNWTQCFEFELNDISISFMNSLSHVLQSFQINQKDEWIQNTVKDIRSFLAITENDFNSQLNELFDLYHDLKLSYTSNIENGLEIMNAGIKQALDLIIQLKQSNQKRKSNSFNILFFKQKVELIKKQLIDAQKNVNSISNQFRSDLQDKKKQSAKIIFSIENGINEFNQNKSVKEAEIKQNQIEFNQQKSGIQKSNDQKSSQLDYYMMLNNIENENAILNRMKNNFHEEIQRLREQNQNDRKKYVDSFKIIHDKICEQMNITNSMYKQLEDLRKKNELERIETKNKYNEEKKQIEDAIKIILNLQNENGSEIDRISNDFDMKYIKAKEEMKMKIEIEKNREENEIKLLHQKLNDQYKKSIQEVHFFFENTSSLKKFEKEYQDLYQRYVNELSSPVFSSAIGYQKSGLLDQLKLKKDETIEKINNERNQLFHKFHTDLNFYSRKPNPTKKQIDLRPSSFYQLTNQENKYLKMLYDQQHESKLEISIKNDEKKKEIRKLKRQLNLVYRIYFTKVLYLIDSFEPFDDSKFIAMLKTDEELEKRIEMLEERIQDLIFNVEIKNRSSQKRIKSLESELDRLNTRFNQIYDEYYNSKKQTGTNIQKNSNKLKIIRAKSNLAPNLISPIKSKPVSKKKY